VAFADLLRKALPATTTDPAARLRVVIASAQARADAAHEAWAEATADEQAAGGTNTSRSDELDESLSRALREVNKITKSLEAVQARQEATAATAARNALEDAWSRAEVLAAERAEVAARLAKAVAAFSATYLDFMKVNADLTGALPEAPDLDAAFLRDVQVETGIRMELQRLGVDWAFNWPYGKISLPDFLEPFKATPDLIHQWRENAMAKARR
jgi:hypothetical protein